MAIKTSFTELVGCLVPIQCAGMGTASPQLAIEVANAGGLGMLSGVMMNTDELNSVMTDVTQQVNGRVGVNFLIPFLEDPDVVDIAARHAHVVDFFFGAPDPQLIERVHKAKALAGWQVGSLQESVQAVEAGCDFIILQGVEAGGHVRGTRGLLTMMADVLDNVSCPVVAAGVIATPRAVAMALSAGASAVRIGTRFVATPESGYHPDYIDALIAAEGEDTVYTEEFRVGWEAPHRVLTRSLTAARELDDEIIAQIKLGEQDIDVPRYSVFSPLAGTTGHIEAMAAYAGQGVSAIKSCEPAARVLRELSEGAETILRRESERLGKMLA